MRRSWKITGLLPASLIGLLIVPASFAASNNQITLTPSSSYPTTSGTAQYQSQPGQAELQIEVDHARALAGQYLSIYVGSSKIGTARVNGRGVAELTRNSELAQRVPRVGSGTVVTVRTGHAATVVSGRF
jgi:hypothetical protein